MYTVVCFMQWLPVGKPATNIRLRTALDSKSTLPEKVRFGFFAAKVAVFVQRWQSLFVTCSFVLFFPIFLALRLVNKVVYSNLKMRTVKWS